MNVGINNNWNADFAIIPLKQYGHYLIDFIAKNEGDYRIRGYLKYNDNRADKIYNEQLALTPGQRLKGVPVKIQFPIKSICLSVNLYLWEKPTRFRPKDVISNLRMGLRKLNLLVAKKK